MTLRPKLPILLNPCLLVARYPNWSLLPRGELKAMSSEVLGILQIPGSRIQRQATVTESGAWEHLSLSGSSALSACNLNLGPFSGKAVAETRQA